ncbi:MAG: hypothetical protein ACRDPQ_16495 [Nocardioidaceae bacterium]
MSSESQDRLSKGQELSRLRRKWVAAHLAWIEVSHGASPHSSKLSDRQRTALHRYRNAETAYFTQLRRLSRPGAS